MPAQNHGTRPKIYSTENPWRNYNPPTVLGNSSYAVVSKFGKKIFVVGGSQVKRIKRPNFNKELSSGKAFSISFRGANIKQLHHYIIPTHLDDKSVVVLLHVGTNDVLSNANDNELANNIINIGLNDKNNGVSKIFISSTISVKKNPKWNPAIRGFNDQLWEHCEKKWLLLITTR